MEDYTLTYTVYTVRTLVHFYTHSICCATLQTFLVKKEIEIKRRKCQVNVVL